MKKLTWLLLLALLQLSQEAHAYGCSKPTSVKEALEGRSALIFTGTVSDIEVWSDRMSAVEFIVEKTHRGKTGPKVVVLFGLDGRDTKWKLGDRYSISAGTANMSGSPNRSPRLFKLGTNYTNYVCDLVLRI